MDGHRGSTVVDHLSKWGWVLPGVNGANDVSGSRHCVNGVKADEEVCGRQQLGGGHFDAIVISRHCEDGVKADEVCGRQKFGSKNITSDAHLHTSTPIHLFAQFIFKFQFN